MPSKIETTVMRVIDDTMLIEGIQLDKYKQQEVDNIESVSVVDLAPTAETLLLSFRSIAKIENLIGLENLTKLCLDNNHIEEIANLESLRKLRWLDLSFNKISKMVDTQQSKASITSTSDGRFFIKVGCLLRELDTYTGL